MVLYHPTDALRQQVHHPVSSSTNPPQHMAGQRQQETPPHQLTHTQQDLLLAALNSQAAGDHQTAYGHPGPTKRSTSDIAEPKMNDNALFTSPQHAELEFNGDYNPDFDYLDGNNYESDNADIDGDVIGLLPGEHGLGSAGIHEKRKNSDEHDSGEEGDSKRQESEKGAKKPGRKPLTSEPTTVSIIHWRMSTFQ